MATLNRSAVPPPPTFSRHGFTLTEMAVVLVIVALLVGGMILPFAAQQEMRTHMETRTLLTDVSEALYGFAASHAASDGKPYLPCPDTDGDGFENRTAAACDSLEGALPWADLGLGRQDAWGNPVRYAVSSAFSNSTNGFALLSSGSLRVCAEAACTKVLVAGVPALILSRGKNGAATPTDADELANADADADFVQRTAGPGGGFDDRVAWLPLPLLLHRMIAAGKLP
jgi:prepilin-type N-terminal cleavage/methylation domain-containing protein